MQFLIQLESYVFWKEIKDFLESVMYPYQAFFIFINTAIAIVGGYISFKLLRVTESTLKFLEIQIDQTQDQVNLMEKQREDSFKPDIVIENSKFDLVLDYYADDFLYPSYYAEKMPNGVVKQRESKSLYYIYILNVGLGTARDVHVEFDFNLEDLIRKTESLIRFDKSGSKIDIKTDGKGTYYYEHTKHGKIDHFYHTLGDSLIGNFSNLMSGQFEFNKMEVEIPSSFWVLYRLICYSLTLKTDHHPHILKKDVSVEIQCRISCKDLYKNSYSKSIKLVFTPIIRKPNRVTTVLQTFEL